MAQFPGTVSEHTPDHPAGRPDRPRQISLFFSEPYHRHANSGYGCSIYPGHGIVYPNAQHPPTPIVVFCNHAKTPAEMPAGDLQMDRAHIDLFRAAGTDAARFLTPPCATSGLPPDPAQLPRTGT